MPRTRNRSNKDFVEKKQTNKGDSKMLTKNDDVTWKQAIAAREKNWRHQTTREEQEMGVSPSADTRPAKGRGYPPPRKSLVRHVSLLPAQKLEPACLRCAGFYQMFYWRPFWLNWNPVLTDSTGMSTSRGVPKVTRTPPRKVKFAVL